MGVTPITRNRKSIDRNQRFINIEKATVRGLSCTELVRLVETPGAQRSVPGLDAKLLRDIGLERSFS